MILAALLLQAAAPTAMKTPCRREERTAGATFVYFGPARECAAWKTSRRRSGVWIFAFEWSQFVENATTIEQALRVDPKANTAAWVNFDDKSGLPAGCRPLLGQAYRIVFEGRDAVPPDERWPAGGGFGHMGLWRNAVLIDQVQAISLLGPLPEPQVRPIGVVATCQS